MTHIREALGERGLLDISYCEDAVRCRSCGAIMRVHYLGYIWPCPCKRAPSIDRVKELVG